jgi:hypothetical protein
VLNGPHSVCEPLTRLRGYPLIALLLLGDQDILDLPTQVGYNARALKQE